MKWSVGAKAGRAGASNTASWTVTLARTTSGNYWIEPFIIECSPAVTDKKGESKELLSTVVTPATLFMRTSKRIRVALRPKAKVAWENRLLKALARLRKETARGYRSWV